MNADWLVERGAALRVDDERLAADLGPAIRNLLLDRPRLAAMSDRMAALARPDATRTLARHLCAMAA